MTAAALNTPKDYALFYRNELGFSVFVLKNPETGTEIQLRDRKRPVLAWEPFQKRHASVEEIENWFRMNPNYNVAIVTGSISRIIVFDVDGPTAMQRVDEKRKSGEMSTNLRVALENTMVNKTGSGGTHIVFRLEKEEDISDISQEKLWSDGQAHSQILMQGNGHYIAAAPSRHPNGKKYEWNGKTPHPIARQELNEFIRLVGAAADKKKMQSRPDVAGLSYNIQSGRGGKSGP